MASPARYTTEEIAEQQKTCYQLRLQHASFRDIAAKTGLSVSTVFERVEAEIAETVAPYREQYQVMQRERLDQMSARLHQLADSVKDILRNRHYTISDGRVVQLDGEPIEDDEFVLKCIDRLVKIEDQLEKIEVRRAKLLGLDAPTRVDATVTETTQEDLELAEMVREAQAKAAAAETTLKGQADGS